MEANKFAYRATGHKCDEPNPNGVFSNCDRNGECHVDILTNGIDNDFGPGTGNKINTDKAFNVKTKFNSDSAGAFTGYTI